MRSRILLIFICVFGSIFGQEVKVLKENLSPKTRIYWDASNKHVQGVGCYFRSEASPNTTEKHGKWLFYSYDGILEEEANYYRGRLHGKRVFYDEQKRVIYQPVTIEPRENTPRIVRESTYGEPAV